MPRTMSLLVATGIAYLFALTTSIALADEPNETINTTRPNRLFTLEGEIGASSVYSTLLNESYYSTFLQLQAEFRPHEKLSLIGRGYYIKDFDVDFATADDDNYEIDKLYLKWREVANLPIAIEAGRLPTKGGDTTHIGLGVETIRGELSNFTNIAIDGISIGVDLPFSASSNIKFYYGTMLEYGYEANELSDTTQFEDTDIFGLKWELIGKQGNKISLQGLAITNVYNIAEGTFVPNPLELAQASQGLQDGSLYQDPATGYYYNISDNSLFTTNTYLDRTNLGDIYHTSLLYMNKIANLNYFLTGGWSHTKAQATDELGVSLLSDFWSKPKDKDGYGVYGGIRYDLDDIKLKLGAEYNYGSKNWLSLSGKLATRGSVYEVYGLYEIPFVGSTASLAKIIIRLAYQYYDYDYTYSSSWLGTPTKIDDIKNDPLASQFYNSPSEENITYCSVKIYF